MSDGNTDTVQAYATFYDANGVALLIDVPLTDPPQRMEHDHQHVVLSSMEHLDGSWEHHYQDRETLETFYARVRPIG